jgi:hypothetical protein
MKALLIRPNHPWPSSVPVKIGRESHRRGRVTANRLVRHQGPMLSIVSGPESLFVLNGNKLWLCFWVLCRAWTSWHTCHGICDDAILLQSGPGGFS